MSSPAKKAIRLGATYIYSGYAKANAAGTAIEPDPQSLEPVRHLVISTESNAVDAQPKSLALWKTDAKGLLHMLGDTAKDDYTDERSASVHYWADGARFNIVPNEAVLNSWAAHREKWPGKLREFLEGRLAGQKGVACKETRVKKKHLRLPDRKSNDEDERAYAKFYDSLSDASPPLATIVFPKTRAAVLLFSDRSFQDGQVVLTPEKGNPTKAGITVMTEPPEAAGLVCAVALGTKDTLPAGLYKIEVQLPSRPQGAWNHGVAKEQQYVLHEVLGFGMTSFAGDFDVVCCDPVSVEEAVMQQFPTLYAHLVAGAANRVLTPTVEIREKDFPVALKPWSERLGWAHAKAKMTVGTINNLGKRPKIVGSAIWEALRPKTDSLGEATKKGIELACEIKEAHANWKELMAELKLERSALKGVKEIIWDDVKGIDRFRWWKYVKEAWKDEDHAKREIVFQLAKSGERPAVLKAGIPQKRTNLQEIAGTKTGQGIEKGLVCAGTAMSVLDVGLAFNELIVAAEKRKQLFDDFKTLVGKVDSQLHRGASREGMGTLERMRTATVAAELGVEKAEGKALMAACDVVLGVLTMLGVGGAALGIVVWAKSTAGLVVDCADYLDTWALNGFVQDLLGRQKAMFKLAQDSRANQSLMPTSIQGGGKDDLHVQFLLRAEALMGLVRLFTRASISTGERDPARAQEKYLAQVKKYRVQEYVERVLLGEGWQFPLKPIVPIGMDSAWLYLKGERSELSAPQAFADAFGYTKPLTAAAFFVPGAMAVFAVVNEVLPKSVVTNYQRTFPIHRMDSKQFEDLAMAFRTAWPEIEKDAVEYTCIHTRPSGSTDDSAWRPINHNGAKDVDHLDILSPYDQIRVLLVLKEKVKGGPYPVSFQLIRTDGRNVKGPIYREITKTLQDSDLLPVEKTKKHAGRIGCVFYPVFRLGAQTIPGTKVLAPGASWGGIYDLLGYLDDMRYSYELRLGGESGGKEISIGGPNGSSSKLDEFRVGLTGKPNEDKLRDMSFLVREGKDFEYPAIYSGGKGHVGPCYARVGNGPWVLATLGEDANRLFPDYDWRTPVEIVMVMQAAQIRAQVYEEQGLDWARLPVTMELVNFVGALDSKGPTYCSDLEYVGSVRARLEKAPSAFTTLMSDWHPSKIPDPGEDVAEWARQVKANPAELKKLTDALAADDESANHVYAAHFTIDYHAPNGAYQKGLRPFGSVLTNKAGRQDTLYRMGVRNIQAPPAIGVSQDVMELRPVGSSWGNLSAREFEFHFPAPVAGGVYPWGPMNEGDVQLKAWVKEEAKARDARVRLVQAAT